MASRSDAIIFPFNSFPDRGGNHAWSGFQLIPKNDVIGDCILNLSEIR